MDLMLTKLNVDIKEVPKKEKGKHGEKMEEIKESEIRKKE